MSDGAAQQPPTNKHPFRNASSDFRIQVSFPWPNSAGRRTREVLPPTPAPPTFDGGSPQSMSRPRFLSERDDSKAPLRAGASASTPSQGGLNANSVSQADIFQATKFVSAAGEKWWPALALRTWLYIVTPAAFATIVCAVVLVDVRLTSDQTSLVSSPVSTAANSVVAPSEREPSYQTTDREPFRGETSRSSRELLQAGNAALQRGDFTAATALFDQSIRAVQTESARQTYHTMPSEGLASRPEITDPWASVNNQATSTGSPRTLSDAMQSSQRLIQSGDAARQQGDLAAAAILYDRALQALEPKGASSALPEPEAESLLSQSGSTEPPSSRDTQAADASIYTNVQPSVHPVELGPIVPSGSPTLMLSRLRPVPNAAAPLPHSATEAPAALASSVDQSASMPDIFPVSAAPVLTTIAGGTAGTPSTRMDALRVQPAGPVPRRPLGERLPVRRRASDKVLAAAGADHPVPHWQPANSRCTPLLARLQLGEVPSPDARHILQTACAPHP
jgi:hypothetical protein